MIECKTGEIACSLKEYYKTNHWQMLIRKYIESDLSNKCFNCKSNEASTHFIHRTKKRIGNEKLTDLLPVCNNCLDVRPEKSKKKNERRQLASLGFNPHKIPQNEADWMLSILPHLRGYVLSKYFSKKASKYNPSKQWINNQVKKTCKWIRKQEKTRDQEGKTINEKKEKKL